jgi:predicted nucleic acid-binding protein
MSALVADASVVVKWFLPEQDSETALSVRDGFVRGDYWLIAPDLLISEIGNALWKRRAILGESVGLEIITNLLSLGITNQPPAGLVARAYELAGRHNRTVYDALYLALAETHSCEMLTSDERLYNAVAHQLSYVRLLRTWQPTRAG